MKHHTVVWTIGMVTMLLCQSGKAEPPQTQSAEAPQPIAQWSFDGQDPELARDTAGGRHPGRIRDAKRVKVGDGHALVFDGQSGVVECAETERLTIDRELTLCAWVWPDRVPTTHVGLAGKSQAHFAMTFHRDRRLYFFVNAGSNKVSAPLPVGRWSHVAATFDGLKLRLYLDGDLAAEAESKSAKINPGGTFTIGRVASRPEYSPIGTWPGRIDQVRLYDRALDAETIARQHEREHPIYQRDALAIPATWQAAPTSVQEQTRPPDLAGQTGRTTVRQAAGYSQRPLQTGGARFHIHGRAPSERTMRWQRGLPAEQTQPGAWYLLRYRAEGFRRARNPYPVVRVEGAGQSHTLLDCTQIINDGLEHVVVGKLPAKLTPRKLAVELSTTGSQAFLELIDVQFPPTPPTWVRPSRDDGLWKRLDLSMHRSRPLDEAIEAMMDRHGLLTDPQARFPGGAGGVIEPEHDNAINRQTIELFGERIERRHLLPVSRDDRIDIAVNDRVSELLLLLVTDAAPSANHYMMPSTPLHLSDIENFAVELIYNDGTRDWAYPYAVADRGYVIRRAVGRYAVAADRSRTLSTVRLHNRWWGVNIALAGMAVNHSAERVFPQLVAEPPPRRTSAPEAVDRHRQGITRHDQTVTVRAGLLEMVLDLSAGFAITHLSPGAEPLDPASGLRIDHDGRIYTGRDFEVRDATVKGRRLALELHSRHDALPVRMTLMVTAEDDQIVFDGALHNTDAQAPLTVSLHVPMIRGLVLGDPSRTWLFFPKYRNELSPRHGTHIAWNDSAFPLQFFDVFDPDRGLGIALLTRNLDHAPLRYRLSKGEGGVAASVEYPARSYVTAPGEKLPLTPTALAGHPGDWREALARYQRWRRSWYEPRQASDRQWFERTFFVRANYLDPRASRRIVKTPSWYTGTPGQFRTEQAMEAIRRYWGIEPGMIHAGGWFHNERGERWSWGDYEYSPSAVGGLESFRQWLGRLEQDRGMHTSLYKLSDRASKGSSIGERIGDRAVRQRADGSAIETDFAWYMDPANPLWREQYVKTLARIERETGVDAIYLDVFSFKQGHASYNLTDAGVRVPTWPNRATSQMIRAVKDALPDPVPTWSEYPLDDVSSQYHDGNIAYYYLTLHGHFAESHDIRQSAPQLAEPHLNVYRFALPHIKQFCFPVGIEGDRNPSRLRMIFFNGEALYDSTWRLFGDRLRRWIGRGIEVQRQYADCFASEDVAMLTPTLRHGVYANRFTGEQRTAWTIYNGRFRTVRGPVLAVPHIEGATYHDAWRDRPLHPRIEDGRAIIELQLGPQACGCVIQRRGESEATGPRSPHRDGARNP